MRRGLTAAGPRRPPSVRPPFFYLPPPHPGCSGILSATRSGTTPPHTQTVAYPTTQASNTRLPHDLLSGAQTNRPHTPPAAPPRAPLPDRHKKAAPGTGTASLHPHPRPHHPPPEPAGKKHPLPATSSTSAPPGKAPPRTSLRPHAPARTREKLRSPPPHIRILAHLHLSPTPCSRAPPKLPLSPPRNARKNVTPHPAGRLPAPPRAFPHLQVPPLPGRHKKSGSPLKAAALRSNRRAISYP